MTKLLTRFELKYIYENSPVVEDQENLVNTIKKARPTEQFLYNYHFCTVRTPEEEGIKVAVMSRPTAKSIYHENMERCIKEERDSIFLESQLFSTEC